MMRLLVVSFIYRSPDVGSRQDRKNERLQECHQQFDQVHKRRKQTANNNSSRSAADAFPVFTEKEDQADEAQNNDVAGRYIGEQTNHQGKRLDE